MSKTLQLILLQIYMSSCIIPLLTINFNPEKKTMSKLQVIKFWLLYLLMTPMVILITPFLTMPVIIFFSVSSLSLFGNIKILQSFWISSIMIPIIILMELLTSELLPKQSVLVISGSGFEAFVGLMIIIAFQGLYLMIIVSLLKKRVQKLIRNITYIKRFQKTLLLIMIVFIVLFILFLLIASPDFYYADAHPALIAFFFFMLVIAGISAIIILDKNFKKVEELNQIKAQLSGEKKSAPRRTPFEESIEFELYNMDFEELFSDDVEIQNAIYSGPNSQIYVFQHKSDQKRFILKAIEKQNGIQYNFDVLNSLDHPNIAPMVKWREGEKYYFIVKAYAPGRDAYSLVKENGPFNEADALKIIRQLCDALSYLHHQDPPLICRDVKPNNIVLDESLTLSLIDIETLRKTSDTSDADTFIVGTKGYAAPEQYGFSQTTAASDIFGIGATLYFLLTGEDPDHKRISLLHTLGDDELPSRSIKPLIPVIQKCMAFSPADRYASVDVLVESYEQLNHSF